MYSFVPLPKSENPDRIRSNIEVFDFEISGEDIEKLDKLDRGKDGSVTWNPVDVD
jgi:diketogulonate reductase-like aldo/keto reductase